MNPQRSTGSPPDWQWKLQIERRLIWLEITVRNQLGNKNTGRRGESRRWEARDWLMTGAGISLIVGALSEKSGLTAVGALFLKTMVKLYGGR